MQPGDIVIDYKWLIIISEKYCHGSLNLIFDILFDGFISIWYMS